VHLRLYDINGRLVRTLENQQKRPGVYSIRWDGADDRGRLVPNGVYFYRLDVPGLRQTRKAVMVK
jgi:flagellar hook assembly protein FlgD